MNIVFSFLSHVHDLYCIATRYTYIIIISVNIITKDCRGCKRASTNVKGDKLV